MRYSAAILILFAQLHALTGNCQEKALVTGRVLEAEHQRPLSGATINISRLKDSSLLKSVVCDADGRFRATDINLYDSLLVKVSYTGYENFQGLLWVTGKYVEVPPYLLHPVAKLLGGVTIKSESPLMVIKGDTTEFKASNFKTPPNSMAEDLLKRIPGLTINDKGKLFFNGHPVTTILVDGRPFFSEDGGVALKNIPVELIDKIQLADLKTMEESMLGVKARGNGKTLNIKLKAGDNYFGNISVAGGTDQRDNTSGLTSTKMGKDRFSLKGGTNNTNSPVGGNTEPDGMALQNGGIARTLSGGLDYSRALKGSNNSFQAGYNFSRFNIEREVDRKSQQNLLPDSSLYTNETSNNTGRNRFDNFKLELKQDKGLNFSSSINDRLLSNDRETNQSTRGPSSLLLNGLSSRYLSDDRTIDWQNSVYYVTHPATHSLFSIKADFNYSQENNHAKNDATTDFYRNGNLDSQAVLHQSIDIENYGQEMHVEMKYTTLLTKSWSFSVADNVSGNWNKNTKATWDLDGNNQKISMDSIYSNRFRSVLLYNTTSIKSYFRKKNWNIQLNADVIEQYQEGINYSGNAKNSYRSLHFSPDMYVQYSKGHDAFSFAFYNQYNTPGVYYLQPVRDNSNPLSVIEGNPAIRPSSDYGLRLSYDKTVPDRHNLLLHAESSFTPISNKVVPVFTYDSLGRQLIQYKNVNGVYSFNNLANGTITFRNGNQLLTVNTLLEFNYSLDKVYINEVPTITHSTQLRPVTGIQYSWGAFIETAVKYAPSFNIVRYDPRLSPTQRYAIQIMTGHIGLYLFKRLKWSTDLVYRYNNSLPDDFKRSTTLWNMRLSLLCLPGKKGELRLSVFDLLHQNLNTTRTATATSIVTDQTNNLQRYFLVGFMWNVSKLKTQPQRISK